MSADLSKAELQSASPAGDEVKQAAGLLSARDQLFGRKVIDRNGTPVGSLHDLVLNMKSGRLVATLVDPGIGLGIGTKGAPRAVPWEVVNLPSDKDQALRLALAKSEFESEPVFISLAPGAPDRNGPFTGSAGNPDARRNRPLTEGPVDRVLPPSPPPTRRTD